MQIVNCGAMACRSSSIMHPTLASDGIWAAQKWVWLPQATLKMQPFLRPRKVASEVSSCRLSTIVMPILGP